jgi:D-alanyl-D-alanine carboxypeptidase
MNRTPRNPPTSPAPPTRIRWLVAVGLTGLLAVATAAIGHSVPRIPSSSPPMSLVRSSAAGPSSADTSSSAGHAGPVMAPSGPDGAARSGALGAADGVVPDGVTVFDDDTPAVANLDPALLAALREAATAAAGDRVVFHVNSGWRSAAYQAELLDEAVSTYGSRRAAARWVATPDTSAHVSGDAVDIGSTDAAAWLSAHGAGYGLCQTYRNEPWHFELRPDAAGRGCPVSYADPSHDPRMSR